MEFYHPNSDDILSIIYEERSYTTTSIETPTHISHHHEILYDDETEIYHEDTYYFSPLTHSSPAQAQTQAQPRYLPPPSPESPWTCSPLQTPSPSLLYHCIASLHRHDGTIYSVEASNGVVFTGSDSTRIRAWRPPDCAERGLLKSPSGTVRAILAHGDTLFTSHKDLKVRVWNFAVVSNSFLFKKLSSVPRKRRSSLSFPLFSKPNKFAERHKDHISCLAYYHAEGLLYTGSYDRTVKAWRVATRRCVDSFVAHEDNVNGILVSQEDGCVFTCSSDGSVKIWRRIYRENSHTLTMILRFQSSPVNAIALSSSGFGSGSGFLYSGSGDGTINFWEKERMSYRFNHVGFLQGHRFAVLCVVAVEKMVFSGSEDTTIRIWRREEGSCLHECLAVLDGHRGPVRCLAACLERERVVMGLFLVYSASLDRTFKVWRVKVVPEEEEEEDEEGRTACCGGSEYSNLDRSDSRTTTAMDQYYDTSPALSPTRVEIKKRTRGKHFR
ncbi:Guanine nucleotide-binding protein, beta subunit [Parasponia andersonii]|uniref:Guanine nucleotide-binding protein, beta subunit n=1 Tax=Parasponia andersonii TaxID=3476 RepID=A0A2P5D3C2_PARAD|nr:Guanine nucleotide-binding protein, beta subunit [Parasponia andersonii]